MKKFSWAVLVAVVVGVLAFPRVFILEPVDSGLVGPDLSLVVALHKAWLEDMRFGRDLIFTYGPLGFLMFPVLISRLLWGCAVLYQVTLHAIFVLSLYAFMRSEQPSAWRAVLLVLTSVLFVRSLTPFIGNATLLVALVVTAYLLFQGKAGRWGAVLAALMGLTAGTLLYIKFSDGITAVMGVFVLMALLAVTGRVRAAAAVASGLAAAVSALGVLLLGSVDGTLLYFANYIHLAGSYLDAVARSGPAWQVDVAMGAWLLLSGLCVHAIVRREASSIIFLILSSALLFTSFKHGFVRQDIFHVISFFGSWAMVFMLFVCTEAVRNRKGMSLAAGILGVVLLLSLALTVWERPKGFGLSSAGRSGLAQAGAVMDVIALGRHERHDLRHDLNAPILTRTVRSMLGRATVDVFPWEMIIAEQAGLTWRPRPIFQSYSVFSRRLDALNEGYFATPDAPEFLLYSHESIDTRYPLFDEPGTFRRILTAYRPVAREPGLLVLERTRAGGASDEVMMQEEAVKLGQAVPVPAAERGYVFAHIEVKYSLLGRLARFLYKPPRSFITFVLENGSSVKHSLVPGTATRGVFVSQYAYDLDDIWDIWHGRLRDNVRFIKVTSPNAALLAEEVRFRFTESSRELSHLQPRAWPDIQALERVPRPLHHIDVVNEISNPVLRQPVTVNLNRSPVVGVSGWAADRKARRAASDVYVTVDGVIMGRASYGLHRPDVARQFGSDDFRYTGWKAFIDGDMLETGNHQLSVIIVSAEGDGYYEPGDPLSISVVR